MVEAAVRAAMAAEVLGLKGLVGMVAEDTVADFALVSARNQEHIGAAAAARSAVWEDWREARGCSVHCRLDGEDENEVYHLCEAGHVSCAHGPLLCPC